MEYKLVSANIVVLANSLNPSIATKEWLLNHVVTEEPKDFVMTPMVSVFKTDRADVIVDQSRLQVNCLQMNEENLNQCSRIVSSYVEKLPHTPYTAIGLNYVWETSKQTEQQQLQLRNKLVAALGCIEDVFTSYSVGANILGVIDNAQVMINIDPSLEIDKPVVIRINYHYNYNDWMSIQKISNVFSNTAEKSKLLIENVVYKRKEEANVV